MENLDISWQAPVNSALVIIDVQKDFCRKGNLEVPQGDEVVPVINNLREHFETVVLTQDHHPAGHRSFASSHKGRDAMDRVWMSDGEIVGEIKMSDSQQPLDGIEHAPVEGAIVQTLWPDHCVQGTEGADFHDDLVQKGTDLLIRKGEDMNRDSYSGFFDNGHTASPVFEDDGTTLTQKMTDMNKETLVFVGLASDFCVAWHALDAIKEGFNAVVVYEGTRPIAVPISEKQTTESLMIEKMEAAGVKIVTVKDLPRTLEA